MRSRFTILLGIAVVCVTTATADWTPKSVVTADNGLSHGLSQNNGRKLVFDAYGVGHVIWHGSSGIWCNRYDPLSGWGPDYQVSSSSWCPAIALDADGTTIHAVWYAEPVRYRRCTRNEYGEDVWGDVVDVGKGGNTLSSSVACVPGEPGHVVVCWDESYSGRGRSNNYEAIGFRECVDGVWGDAILLDSSGTDWRRVPSIAVAPNGDVFISYMNGARHICVKTRHEGTWGTTEDAIADFPSIYWGGPAAIEVNPVTGNPHIVFSWYWITKISKKVSDTTYAAYHTYRNSSGAWLATPELVSTLRHGFGWTNPTMAFLDDGAAYAVWHWTQPQTSRGVMYNYCLAEGAAWRGQAWLSSDTVHSGGNGDACPVVAVDEYADAIRVAWGRDTLGVAREIWWRSNYLGGGGPTAQPTVLSQSSIELFPNPAKAGCVTVQYSPPHDGQMAVTLLDVSGRAVRTQEVAASGATGSFSLDAQGLNPGVYFLKLESGATSQTRKLVIQ